MQKFVMWGCITPEAGTEVLKLEYPNDLIAMAEGQMIATVKGFTQWVLHDSSMSAIYHSDYGVLTD